MSEAYNGLTPVEVTVVDKGGLQAVIEQAEQLNKEDYTEEAWKAFEESLNKAKAVYDNKDASQKDVNKEITALAEAMAELKKHPAKTEEETDKSALKALIDEASQLKKDDYTGTTWKKFQKAFDDAANIYESETATQEQIRCSHGKLCRRLWTSLKKLQPDQIQNPNRRLTTIKTKAKIQADHPAVEARKEPLLQKQGMRHQSACLQVWAPLH